MDKFKLAYFAGYIDGDGFFNLQIVYRKRKHVRKISKDYTCQLCISGKQRNCLDFFKDTFGGAIYNTPKIEGQAQVYLYRLCINRQSIIRDVCHFLVERKEQAKICLDFKDSPTQNRECIIEQIKACRQLNKVTDDFKSTVLPERRTVTPSKEDFAYLAGFIDAECCIQINKKRDKKAYSYKAKLRCGNSKTPTIRWMIQRFGGNVFLQKNEANNRSDIVDYHLEGPHLLFVLENTLPFLIHKSEQCFLAIKLLKLIQDRVNPMSKDFPQWKIYSETIKEEIYHKVKYLNKRGS